MFRASGVVLLLLSVSIPQAHAQSFEAGVHFASSRRRGLMRMMAITVQIRRIGRCFAVVVLLALAFNPTVWSFQEPPAVRYRENRDYHLNPGADTLVWVSFMLDHAKWPLRRELGISKHGFVICLNWTSRSRADVGTARLYPNEIEDLFDLIENRVALRSLKSRARERDEPYSLYAIAAYGLPSRREATVAVFGDAQIAVAPLRARLEELWRQSGVGSRRAPEAGDPDVGATLETLDSEFLTHHMTILHLNDMLTMPRPKQ